MLLMIDNYDSFTYNLVQYFGELGQKVNVYRSTFLVNENGKIFKVFEKVKAKGHSKEVLEAYASVE